MSHNLFLGEVNAGEEVHGLLVAKVNVVAEQEDEDQLAHILLLLVAIHTVTWLGGEGGGGGRTGGEVGGEGREDGRGGTRGEEGGEEGGGEGERGSACKFERGQIIDT